MTENIVPVFTCDFCGKKQFRKCDMTLHERWCKKNPNNLHKCFEFCIHLKKYEVEYEGTDRYGEEYLGKKTEFTCDVLKKQMFSFIAEKRRLPVINELHTSRMPLECDKYDNGYGFYSTTVNESEYLNF
jgi:hypothetical protein